MTKQINLTQGKVAILDDEQFARCGNVKWYALRAYKKGVELWYAARGYNGSTQYLHRVIMDAPKGITVDHINGNGLDCRKKNMRLCSQKDNRRNSRGHFNRASKYKGVSISHNYFPVKYSATVAGKFIGLFKTEIEAARAYNKVALEKFGEYARLNEFPKGEK